MVRIREERELDGAAKISDNLANKLVDAIHQRRWDDVIVYDEGNRSRTGVFCHGQDWLRFTVNLHDELVRGQPTHRLRVIGRDDHRDRNRTPPSGACGAAAG